VITKIVLICIMCFALGLKLDVSNKTREVANIVWMISIGLLWLTILFK